MMKMLIPVLGVTALLSVVGTTAARAQVVISEVWANPTGGGSSNDDRYEYIELYGRPGMSLNGYAIAGLFGGGDPNANNVPGPIPVNSDGQLWDEGDELPEIDEAWSLDGLTIGSNGFLVLYANPSNNSFIPALLPAATARATFGQTFISSNDVSGRIKNDGSATYVLVRRRPFHALTPQGTSLYDGSATYFAGSRYAWRKDVNPDVNFDGKVDLNGIATLGGSPFPPEVPVDSEETIYTPIPTPAPSTLEPYQMVDDVAISNGGGKEYVRRSDQEISETPAFNPDAISRVGYFGSNPNLGDRLNSQNQVVPTRSADEEWIYGEVPVNSTRLFDAVKSGGPTFPGQPAGARFADISRTGFRLTPGTFNDGATTGPNGVTITQFRFVRGDFNFDGQVTCADRELLVARQGATLDDTITYVDDRGTTDPSDDLTITNWWKWQGRDLNGLLAMNSMNPADGPAGANAAAVTTADLAQFDAEFPGLCAAPCPADFNRDGFVDDTDFVVFAQNYDLFSVPPADATTDLNSDGFVDDTDFVIFAAAYDAFVCP